MTSSQEPDITGLLGRIRADDPDALSDLLSQLYDQLRQMATELLSKEAPGHTLQPTALVHEAVRRVLGSHALDRAPDRRFLFATVHKTMCRVLVDHARRRVAIKRGGAYHRVPLDDVVDQIAAHWSLSDIDLIAIYDALGQLEQRSIRQRSVVNLKIFGCMSNREVAEELGVSEGTVERDFRLARAFLSRQLERFAPS